MSLDICLERLCPRHVFQLNVSPQISNTDCEILIQGTRLRGILH